MSNPAASLSLTDQALYLASEGFHVLPLFGITEQHHRTWICNCTEQGHCGSPGKHPIFKGGVNGATTSAERIREWWSKHPHANIGIACGKSGLLVLDIDPRNGGELGLKELETAYGQLPETYTVYSGRDDGGRHLYFRATAVHAKRSPAEGIDFQSAGKYVVGPGSIHGATGLPYKPSAVGNLTPLIAPAPGWLLELATKGPPAKPVAIERIRPVSAGLFGAALKHAGWLGDALSADKWTTRCPFGSDHTTGHPGDSSTIVYAPDGKDGDGVQGYIKCEHGHCKERTQRDFWLAIPAESREHAKHQLHVSALFEPGEAASEDWTRGLLFDSQGKLRKLNTNYAIILRHDDEFRGCLQYDQFADRIQWVRSPPTVPGLDPIAPGVLADSHVNNITHYLSYKYNVPDPGKDGVLSAVVSAAVPVHPVRQYLDALVWDVKPRVQQWLNVYLGAPDTAYTRLVSMWSLVAAVARIYEPGCSAQYVTILEGSQGTGKSTALRVLGHPWFVDTPIDLHSKDAYSALRNAWIYELQELASLSRAELDKAKAFFSSPIDVFRRPYDRMTSEVPRQCVFFGTVNPGVGYLRDETGNRRFWPVETAGIDLEWLRKDKDQLWAEAVHMYRLGFRWEPLTQQERDLCTAEQELRMIVDEDPWIDMVREATGFLTKCRTTEILAHDVFKHTPRDHRASIRVAKCLKQLGWTKKVISGYPHWYKPD